MRKRLFLLAAGTLILALPHAAVAQTPDRQPPSSAFQNPSQPSTTPPNADSAAADSYSSQPDQPLSLGEVARLARASKKSQVKATKIFDDDNMPRAPLVAGEKAPGLGSQGPSSRQGSSGGGKVTLLDFWATWCGPCRRSLPGLKELASSYGGNNLEIISVSEDEDEDAWHTFVVDNDMTWTQRLDADHEMMRQYGASSLPTYVLVGRDGNVVQQYVGYDPGESLADRIGPDLKKSLDGSL
jgi:thiol-disulfide isomerase/thioredoxin